MREVLSWLIGVTKLRALLTVPLLLALQPACSNTAPTANAGGKSTEIKRSASSAQNQADLSSKRVEAEVLAPTDPWLIGKRNETSAAAKRMRACGFTNVEVTDDPAPTAYWVRISTKTATKTQLSCVARVSAETGVDVGFIPDKFEIAYAPVHTYWTDKIFMKESRELLARRGVLSRVPKYRPGKSNILVFARSLERLCGAKARGAFRMSKPGRPKEGPWREIVGQITWNDDVPTDYDTMRCLYAAVEVSGLPSFSLYSDH